MNKRLLLLLAMSAGAVSLAGCATDRTRDSSPKSDEVLVVPAPSSSDSGATTAPANPPTVIVVPVEPQETPPSGSMGGSAPGGSSEQWREDFRQLDANGDGLIDQNEAQGDVNFSALFGRLDMNSDGVISPSEYEAMHSGSGAGGSGGEGGSEAPDAVIVPGPAVIVPQEDPAAGASAGGSAGSSERASSGSGYTFQQLDGDNDTQIDRQEAQQHPALSDDFEQADLNKDDVITGSEYDTWSLAQEGSGGSGAMGAGAAGGESVPFTFQQLDGDNDTQVDRQEAQQYPALSDSFDQADVNKDEVITGTEYDNWSQTRGESSGTGAAGAGAAGGTSGSGYTFQQLDGDNDTYISKQEAQQYPALSDDFEQADVNKDQVITGTEYDTWAQKQGG